MQSPDDVKFTSCVQHSPESSSTSMLPPPSYRTRVRGGAHGILHSMLGHWHASATQQQKSQRCSSNHGKSRDGHDLFGKTCAFAPDQVPPQTRSFRSGSSKCQPAATSSAPSHTRLQPPLTPTDRRPLASSTRDSSPPPSSSRAANASSAEANFSASFHLLRGGGDDCSGDDGDCGDGVGWGRISAPDPLSLCNHHPLTSRLRRESDNCKGFEVIFVKQPTF